MMYRRNAGFTLIEMIVAVGIFSFVMLAATSAYLNLIALDRRARATNQVVNNLNFAVDAMMRGIRTGSNFYCINGGGPANGGNSTSGCTQFTYVDSTLQAPNNVVTYFLSGTSVYRNEGSAYSLSSATASRLTDPSITITSMVFRVRGVGTGDGVQPQVTVSIKGTMPADSKGGVTTFVIQETATQRLIEI